MLMLVELQTENSQEAADDEGGEFVDVVDVQEILAPNYGDPYK